MALTDSTLAHVEGYQVMLDGKTLKISELSHDQCANALKEMIDFMEAIDEGVQRLTLMTNTIRYRGRANTVDSHEMIS